MANTTIISWNVRGLNAQARRDSVRTLADDLSPRARSFAGGLSSQAILDYLHLWNLVDTVNLTNQPDRTVWRWTPDGQYTARALGLQQPPPGTSIRRWWKSVRRSATGNQSKGLDTLFALVSWHLWKERNARCFNNTAAPVAELLQLIKFEGERWIQAGARGLECLVQH